MNFYVKVLGIASQKAIETVTKESPNDSFFDLMGLFCSYSEFDIPLGHSFSYLVARNNRFSFQISCEVRFVTQAWGKIFDQIPSGHKTLCFVKLDDHSKRLFMENLIVVDSWGYHSNIYYLSDMGVLPIESEHIAVCD
jgi:hypothetical protein